MQVNVSYRRDNDFAKTGFINRKLSNNIKNLTNNWAFWFRKNGGAKEDRTPDLYAASVALSQLSYSPVLITIT